MAISKALANSVYDAATAEIATCTRMDVTSDTTNPANLTNTLAYTAMTAGLGGGDYTAANGDVSGRKVTMTSKSGVTVNNSGTATCVCLSLAGIPKVITTCTSQVLTAGNTITFPAWKVEINTPT